MVFHPPLDTHASSLYSLPARFKRYSLSKKTQQQQRRCWWTLRNLMASTMVGSLFLNAFMLFIFLSMDRDDRANRTIAGTMGTNSIVDPHALVFQSSKNINQFVTATVSTTSTSSNPRNRQQQQSQQEPLPDWIIDYTAWHQSCRMEIQRNASSWRNYNFLILRCLYRDETCGGLADRRK